MSFAEVLSVAVEVVVYLDVCSVGRLAVVSNEVRQMVKECKFGADRMLMECRRVLGLQRARVSREVVGRVVARVVHAVAGARRPLCDLVALGWRIDESSELSHVKKFIMEAGNKLTHLMHWCKQRGRVDECLHPAVWERLGRSGIYADRQIGAGRDFKFITWPRKVWEAGVPADREESR